MSWYLAGLYPEHPIKDSYTRTPLQINMDPQNTWIGIRKMIGSTGQCSGFMGSFEKEYEYPSSS